MCRDSRFGDGEGAMVREKPEGYLPGRGAVSIGDFVERPGSWHSTLSEWAVCDHRDPVRRAPGNHGVLDSALLQIVEDLVADNAAFPGDREGLLQIALVEVADPPG